MEDEVIRLAVKMAINESGSFNAERNIVPSDPAKQIRQEIAVVRQIVSGKSAVEIGGEEGDAASVCVLAKDKAGSIALRFAHPDRFRRINRKWRNQRQRNLSIWVELKWTQIAAKGEKIGFLEQQRRRKEARASRRQAAKK